MKKSSKPSTSKPPKKEILETAKLDAPTPAIDTLNPGGFALSKKTIIWGSIALVFVILGFVSTKSLLVATVNGKPIYRWSIVAELEKQGGKYVLDQLITEQLILDKAKEAGVTVTPEEIDQEITKITENVTSQGQDLNSALEAQGMTLEDLKQQVRTNLLTTKLKPPKADPTEEEIQAMIDAQKDSFPEEMTEQERYDSVKQYLSQESAADSDAWVNSLKESANIQYFREY